MLKPLHSIGPKVAGSPDVALAHIPHDLVDLHLSDWPGQHLQSVAQAHRAQLTMGRRQRPGEKDVDVTLIQDAQAVAGAADHILDGVPSGRLDIGRDVHAYDLGYSVPLFGLLSSVHQRVWAIAHLGRNKP